MEYRLVLVTPILKLDSYSRHCSASLTSILNSCPHVAHLIVSNFNQAHIKQMFPNSIVIKEGASAGVYSALADGFSYATNYLSATHLSWINNDDILTEGFLDVIADSIRNSTAICRGNCAWIDVSGVSLGRIADWPLAAFSAELFETRIPPFTQQSVIFPASAWVTAGGFDMSFRLIADSVFWHSLLKRGFRIRRVNRIAALYRQHDGQLSANRTLQTEEHSRWIQTMSASSVAKTRIAELLFRMWNFPLYARRIFHFKR